MTDCIFCKIINKEIPSYTIYEDEDIHAFLDISQVSKGHTLVIPKKHVANIFEYDEALAARVFTKIPGIARAVRAFDPEIKGLNLLNNNGKIASQSVFHSHFHLIPRYSDDRMDGFGLKWDTHGDNMSPEDFAKIKDSIISELEEKS